MINAYRNGMADYGRNAPEEDCRAEAYADASYRPSRIALKTWSDPATTLYGAVHALRMANEADQNDDAEIVSVMIRAALGYFDANLGSIP
jgi:hypothetical protein